MTFKPYCHECNSWHGAEEGHAKELPVDQKAFRAEASHIRDLIGCSLDQAEMLAAVKYWPPRQLEIGK